MIAAAGWTAAALGMVSSIALAVLGLRAQRRPDGPVQRSHLRWATLGMMAGSAGAMLMLQLALLTDDFSVSYVAETSARATPLPFKISTAWSALNGSLVLWTVVLSGFTVAVLRQVRSVQDRLGSGALAVLGIVGAFFFGLVVSVANPFLMVETPPLDGPGPNPILQNHYMILVHPPMLYLGFVGFTVPFAFAISALLLGENGVDWLRRTRRANLVAWSFLSGGLVYGAWWSYEVLGWGGFWAWDPVENAALIPWLLATALIHSSVIQVRRGMLPAWNLVLVLATFASTILGTFLTRSSVIVSVHSFTQSGVGPALLGFLLVVVVGGSVLFALRGGLLATDRRLETLASREGAFVANNVILTVFAFIVLLGTLYPVLVEALNGDQLSVGRPFFDRMAVPLSFALLTAMGVGPFLPYRRASVAVLWVRLRIPLLVAAAAAATLVLTGVRSVPVVVVAFLVALMLAGTARELVTSAPSPGPRSVVRLVRGRRGYWGGQLAHAGLALVALSIALSGSLADRASFTMRPQDSVAFAGYTITYDGDYREAGANRTARVARIVIRSGDQVVRVAEPRLTQFTNQVQAVATPSVWTRPTQDIYVALSSFEPESIGLNVYRYPFQWLLWAGGSMVMLGGLWALSGRTRRSSVEHARPVKELPTDVASGA